MTATGVALSTAGLWTVFRRDVTSSTGNLRLISARRSALHTEQAQTTTTTSSVLKNRRLEKINGAEMIPRPLVEPDFSEAERASLKDYFEQSKDLIRSDGGPPRWFSPLESGSQMKDSPLLLFLPGVDGVGLGLILHHQRLGKIFDIWCLHIPVMDRTPFTDLVKLVEETIRTENSCSPNRPIYLFGESLGGCLALAVAARNPTIDLVLILANPATSFSKSLLPPLIPLLEIMPDQLYLSLPYMLSLMGGFLSFLLLISISLLVNSYLLHVLVTWNLYPAITSCTPPFSRGYNKDALGWNMLELFNFMLIYLSLMVYCATPNCILVVFRIKLKSRIF